MIENSFIGSADNSLFITTSQTEEVNNVNFILQNPRIYYFRCGFILCKQNTPNF